MYSGALLFQWSSLLLMLFICSSFFRHVLVRCQCQYRLRTPFASKVSFAVAKTTTTIARDKRPHNTCMHERSQSAKSFSTQQTATASWQENQLCQRKWVTTKSKSATHESNSTQVPCLFVRSFVHSFIRTYVCSFERLPANSIHCRSVGWSIGYVLSVK